MTRLLTEYIVPGGAGSKGYLTFLACKAGSSSSPTEGDGAGWVVKAVPVDLDCAVKGVAAGLLDVVELTREIGCRARTGAFTFF